MGHVRLAEGWIGAGWHSSSPDGSRFLASLDVATGAVRELGALNLPSLAEIGRISLSRQTQRIALAVSKPRGDIWMPEGFSGAESPLDSILHSFYRNEKSSRRVTLLTT